MQSVRLANAWLALRTNFWFVPILTVMAALVASIVFPEIDRFIGDNILRDLRFLSTAEANSAQTILSTIAGSLITIAGVTFSITVVGLTLTTSQFGPRLLNTFMRDTVNQFVLGYYLATASYCLIILQTIREDFIPNVSIALAIIFAIMSFFILIYFIHHIASMIKVDVVIAQVDDNLKHTISSMFPEEAPRGQPGRSVSDDLPEHFERDAIALSTQKTGYLQGMDIESLLWLATEQDIVLSFVDKPGSYIVGGSTIAFAWPPQTAMANAKDIEAGIDRAVIVGYERTPTQDMEYCIDQLVEIALRAFSPGINDLFTGLSCIDRLGGDLSLLATRQFPENERRDSDGNIRLVWSASRFEGFLDAAFNSIRQNAAQNVAVYVRLLEALRTIANHLRRPEDALAVKKHVVMVERMAQQHIIEPHDLEDIQERKQWAVTSLNRF
ncbi:DUF2254 domain-containing protein [Desulfovibrio inopinatus]|uniref:DUF2254 domain-containing protein n=1 Tax=Desulfovibrio inopinatus TaxID=102109 RepID=UPI000404177A|nr:DUF2254 domain-containing protein [Desulfovibrio inopinatus]